MYPWMMPYGMANTSNVDDLEKTLNFIKKIKEGEKKEERKRHKFLDWDYLALVLFVSPFVGASYSYAIVALNKTYIIAMSNMLK